MLAPACSWQVCSSFGVPRAAGREVVVATEGCGSRPNNATDQLYHWIKLREEFEFLGGINCQRAVTWPGWTLGASRRIQKIEL